jgi:hypothetical protein
MGRTLSYRDAVVLLGGDPPVVAALDRALGGALSVATGGVSTAVLSVFDAQGGIVRFGRDLMLSLRGRLRGAGRVERTQRLEAAHAVIVVTAYFEALADAPLPFAVRDLRITRQEQVRLAGGPESAEAFLEALLTVAPPRPAAHLPYERFLDVLWQWYGQLSSRLAVFVRGLAVWDGMDDAARAETERVLGDQLSGAATGRFQELYSQLAREVPEFGFWSGQIEHQATRAEIRWALADVESLLASMSSAGTPVNVASALSCAYRAALPRPILADGDAPAGMRLPTLDEGYLDPDFRVRQVGEDRPSDEAWWSGVPVRSDLPEYLVAALTSPEAAAAPLVVLGHPGAGKSVLTKVLAARLPPGDFLPVRVVLREAPAEADVQNQIEYAIRAATGERAEWPNVARAAGGALPVVLLDGFDELLQATGVSQSDYLLKVAQFQRREADQGRPVAVLVTSRTAVADRAAYPEGTVALRLEPFRAEQIGSWLDRWNQLNEGYLAGRGLAPLPASVAVRHAALASQPLLLMMLALYDADANALQCRASANDEQALDEATLYGELLTSFAAREVGKSGAALPADEAVRRVEQELQRLSLVAFGMINRRRQWVTEAELESDLTALLGPNAAASSGFKAPLTQADVALGRFFFVQRAQAVRDGTRLQTYEFLHATFGEYLAARLAVQLAAGMLTRWPALTVGPTVTDDDLLYALLSFAPLSSRQLLRFVVGVCGRQVTAADRRPLAGLLVNVLAGNAARTGHRYATYHPAALPVSSRHSIYSANVVLLILVLMGGASASELFPASGDPAGAWSRGTLLWRSALTEEEWSDLALALSIRHTWNGPSRDLQILLASDPPEPPERVDPYWHYRYPPSHEERGNVRWNRAYWSQLDYKMDIAGGTNDSVVRHALEPIFRWLGPTVTTFMGLGNGPASSAAHDLLDLWLSSTLGGDGLEATCQRCIAFLAEPPVWDAATEHHVLTLVLNCLRSDACRLPATAVVECLKAAVRLSDDDDRAWQLTLESALAALTTDPEERHRTELTEIITQSATAMRRIGHASGLLAWITIQNAGLTHCDAFKEDPGQFLTEFPFSTVAETHPQLLKQAQAIVAKRYAGFTIQLR